MHSKSTTKCFLPVSKTSTVTDAMNIRPINVFEMGTTQFECSKVNITVTMLFQLQLYTQSSSSASMQASYC